MHPRARGLTRDLNRLTTRRRDLAVSRDGELQRDIGALLAHAQEMPRMGARGLVAAQPDIDLNARLAQPFMALPRDTRIGVLNGRDDTPDSSCDNGIHAGRRLAVMR